MRTAGSVGVVSDRFVPADLRLGRPLAIPPSLCESELSAHMAALAARNQAEPARSMLKVFLDGKLIARQPTDSYPKTILARDGLLIN